VRISTALYVKVIQIVLRINEGVNGRMGRWVN
jgi:hypothetical protein